MTECGDVILKLFHSHNLTYSNGINLEKLTEIIQNSEDKKTSDILKKITDKFMKKLLDNMMYSADKTQKKDKKEKKKEKKKDLKKNEIKCLECRQNNNNSNNIFNSVDRELLGQLLILPNNYGFHEKKENQNEKY